MSPKPFFFASGWYALPPKSRTRVRLMAATADEKALWAAGKRFRDGVFRPSEAVRTAFAAWKAVSDSPQKPDPLTVSRLFERYLADLQNTKTSKRTISDYRGYLTDFSRQHGDALAASVTPSSVRAWIASHPNWASGSTQRKAAKAIKQTLNWAVSESLLPESPLKSLKLTSYRDGRRGKEALISTEEEQKLLAAASPSFRNFLFCLLQTGRRPSEIASLTPANVDFVSGVMVFRLKKHKNEGKTGESETVYLTESLAAVVRDRITLGAPWLFPRMVAGQSTQYTRASVVRDCTRARERAGLRSEITSYSARHTFITRALAAGISASIIAAQCGNSVQIISRHYDQTSGLHVNQMTAAIERLSGC